MVNICKLDFRCHTTRGSNYALSLQMSNTMLHFLFFYLSLVRYMQIINSNYVFNIIQELILKNNEDKFNYKIDVYRHCVLLNMSSITFSYSSFQRLPQQIHLTTSSTLYVDVLLQGTYKSPLKSFSAYLGNSISLHLSNMSSISISTSPI